MRNDFDAEPGEAAQNALNGPLTREREAAIEAVLREEAANSGLPIRQIADKAKLYLLHGPAPSSSLSYVASSGHHPKHDSVTIQAYHKLVNRLVALGRLEELPTANERGERLYKIAQYLYVDAANPLTLDDLFELAPTQIMARAADAADYLNEKRTTVLRAAAEALKQEDPRELVFQMIKQKYEVLQKDVEIYAELSLRDPGVKARVEREAKELDYLLYRLLGIPPATVNIQAVKTLLQQNEADAQAAPARSVNIHLSDIDEAALHDALKARIFGDTFLSLVDVGASRVSAARKRLTVAGSDGSTHAGILQLRTARSYIDEDENIVTFNNAMAYVEQASTSARRADWPFYSVPITRAALDDPGNRGMILARPMFPDMEQSEYEHMAKCATDVVQWRVDDEVFNGKARPINPSKITQSNHNFSLPAPVVHIRDGTVVPQEREWGHYKRPDAYGDMVREGQNRMRSILQRLRSEDNKQVFAGATKSTQMRIFSKVVSWYVARGSENRHGGNGKSIDPAWEERQASGLADNQLMTYLLSCLTNKADADTGRYWVTCVISRPFHATTEFYNRKGLTNDAGWMAFFQRLAQYEETTARENGDTWLWETADWEDDSFVYLCRRADFGLFYIGHTGGDPPPSLPRYEFLDSLRGLDADEANARATSNVRKIVEALDHTKVAIDSDHNYLSNKRLVKIIPYVVARAHEATKTLGRNLENELRNAVFHQLSLLRRMRGLTPGDIHLLPAPIKRFLERSQQGLDNHQDGDSPNPR